MAPPRGLMDDLKWALAVLAGVALAALIFSADVSALVGAVAGVALVLAVRALLRRRRRAAGGASR
jgi:hypothetical protein